MTQQDAMRLRPGDVVVTYELPPNEEHIGEVRATGHACFEVRWDDGDVGVLDYDDHYRVSRIVRV